MPDVKHFDPDTTLDTVVRLFWRQGTTATGIQDVVAATGLSRSSLYATFGGKRELHLAALQRYVEERSRPAFTQLATDGGGFAAIGEFFHLLIEARCSGEHAGWGCMVSNTHLGVEVNDPDVRQVLARHHDQLRAAMRAALEAARLRPGIDLDMTAEQLALLAYGVNVHSRSGADAAGLRASVDSALDALTDNDTTDTTEETPEHG